MNYKSIFSLKGVLAMTFAFGMLASTPAQAGLFKKKKKPQPTAPAPKPAPKPQVDREGLFHVTKMKDTWYFDIPDSLMGRDFLTTTRFTGVPTGTGKYAGEQLNQQTVYFEQIPDSMIVMRARLLVNHCDTADVISRAVTISNTNPIIGTFKIDKRVKGGSRIKVQQFFMEDNAALGVPQSAKTEYKLAGQMGGYIEDIKSFPMNTEVKLVKTFGSSSTSIPAARATGKVTLGLNISFVLLPSEPMVPRKFDPRVGYFTHGYNTFGDDQQRVDKEIYISRYRLEPKNSEDSLKMLRGELIEPKKPIVYYIDPATPKQWRKYLIMGVNDWQTAFEKAGWKNAIHAEEWPEDSTMSMEDARYCVIRYLASDIANAYGPHVSDPRTGEILESHIGWYHNVMSLVHDWYMVQASSVDEAARKMKFSDELMGQLIRFVSSHEVGHTLGLRHNFGSSSTVPVDSLRSKEFVRKNGHTPSIMDYARFNYVAQPEDGMTQELLFPRINDYDKWAIEWGYRPTFAKNADDDHKKLEAKTREAQKNRRLWWGDGEGYRNDPRRQTEDLGDDAVKASEYGIKNLKREIVQLADWTYEETDIYDENAESMHGQFVNQFLRYCGHVIGNIGGQLVDFKPSDVKGDVFVPQPKAKQLAAIDFVKRHVISEPSWLRDVSYAKRFTPDPQNITIKVGQSVVSRLLGRLSALNELYTAEDYLKDLTAIIMPAASGKPSRYTAALQTAYVEGLIALFKPAASAPAASASAGAPANVKAAVLATLKQLKSKTAASGLAHYQYINDLISRALVIK